MISILPVTEASVFNISPYSFYMMRVWPRMKHVLPFGFERTFYCLEGYVRVNDKKINQHEVLQSQVAENWIEGGDGLLLIAETPTPSSFVKYDVHKEFYTVTKPWGYELWINGENAPYSFKKIFIKAGNQTSLQYHNFKEETNIIYEGKFELVQKNTDTPNDDVTETDLLTTPLEGPVGIHVLPKTIHRLRAITDLTLYEVSTPFLNDVIRLMDDSKRGNGRIEAEHK